MDNIIKISEVTYKKEDKIIIDKLSLDIEKNTWVSIVGPNGSGKSTIIKILLGILPYEGYISIDNILLDKVNINEVRRKLGIVLDNIDNQLITQNTEDELAFPLENLNYPKQEIKKEIDEISTKFMIKHLLNQPLKNITNKEKQLVLLSSALITNPKILLLDDAFHQIDNQSKKIILNKLKDYKKEHKLTIIMVTHNLEDTLYSDKIVIINKGKKVIEGTPLSILKQDNLLKENSLNQPFIIELSQKLMLYNLISHIYLDERKLVMDLWK